MTKLYNKKVFIVKNVLRRACNSSHREADKVLYLLIGCQRVVLNPRGFAGRVCVSYLRTAVPNGVRDVCCRRSPGTGWTVGWPTSGGQVRVRSAGESGIRRGWTVHRGEVSPMMPSLLGSGRNPIGGEGVRGARLEPPDRRIRVLPLLNG